MERKFSRSYKLWITLLSILIVSICHAQYPVVRSSIDKNEILIGEQITLSVQASFNGSAFIPSLPVLPDSMEHFEVVDKSKADSVYANGELSSIAQQFIITSFDSGRWTLPPVKMNFGRTGNAAPVSIFTDSFPVIVSFSTSDTSSNLRDIKPVRGAEKENTMWYWIAAAILLAALVVFIIWFYRHWKKNKATQIFKAALSPLDEAMQELQLVKKMNASHPDEVKKIHTKLADILRRYLSRKDNVLYLNKTSGDVLLLLSDKLKDTAALAVIAGALRTGDAVKFAKYFPPQDVNNECTDAVIKTIRTLEEKPLTNKQ